MNPDLHPDIAAHLLIRAGSGAMLGRTPVDPREAAMLWKIIGIVAVVWIALAVIGALLEGLFPILVISAIVFGLYLLYKAVSGSGNSTVDKL
ncbi:hypothetical protein ACL02S_12175 [Nocardia sp. 004]|uniref:hypothetical protein n=1 Tax=Nocardia sp. 004 TaxID=3385978 RepID=UPI0039A216A2